MRRCLIYLDETDMQNSIDLLEVARQIYVDEAYETTGVAFNSNIESALGAFDRVIQITHPKIKTFDQKVVSDAMAELQELNKYNCILIPATSFGRMLAPRLAMLLKTGLVADVTAIKRNDSSLEIIRPAFSGRIMAGIKYVGDGPVMMSVRRGVFHYDFNQNKLSEITMYKSKDVLEGRIQLLAVKEKEHVYDVRESDVLVSGGGGVIRNFDKLKELAKKLGAQVSASRKIVDAGIAPRSIQIGQSGKTVSPKLYIALGIHGAIQHVEGLKNIENIISVNINKDAPICSLSDIVVEGDARIFIEKLIEKIEKHT